MLCHHIMFCLDIHKCWWWGRWTTFCTGRHIGQCWPCV